MGMGQMTEQHPTTTPPPELIPADSDLSPADADDTCFDRLHEIHTIACAAAHALKCIDWHLEKNCDRDDFTYEDAAGCVYSIKRALHMLDGLTRSQGLKSDPLYPEWSPDD